MTVRFLYDTAVFVYATGGEHPYRDPCRAVLRASQEGAIRGEASVELVQEFLHLRTRRTGDRSRAAADARAVWRHCTLHDVTVDDLQRALQLFPTAKLGSRDALMAATALNRGIPYVLTSDRGFDRIDGLERIDPHDAVDVLTS